MTKNKTPPKPSIAMVAERAGVSIATVSRVMNGINKRASKDTIKRVKKAVQELNYRPGSIGRALRKKESRLIALIAANLANPAMSAIAASVEESLREIGYTMVLCDSHERPELQEEYMLEMRSHFASGFIFLGAVQSPSLEEFAKSEAPTIYVNREPPTYLNAPFVGIDNARAGMEVADLFIKNKIKNPVLVHASLESSATKQRVDSFCQRFKSSTGISPVLIGGAGLDHIQIGYDSVDRLVSAGNGIPAAIFCLSDLIAFGAYKRLGEAGISVPLDCLIMGFDDNPLNDWVAPWLNSVRVPYQSFGPAIVNALQNAWQGNTPEQTILEHRIVIRCGFEMD